MTSDLTESGFWERQRHARRVRMMQSRMAVMTAKTVMAVHRFPSWSVGGGGGTGAAGGEKVRGGGGGGPLDVRSTRIELCVLPEGLTVPMVDEVEEILRPAPSRKIRPEQIDDACDDVMVS